MKFAVLLPIQRVIIGCLCAGALGAVACTDGREVPTSPDASPAVSLSAASPRSGALHLTKECSAYTFLAGSYCTITSSNVKAIEVGSRIVYAQAAGATSLDSDVILDLPGPGNNTAFGHCALDFATGVGLCTFSGGTGKFTWFHASADVSYLGGPNWRWEGTYSFSPRD
ncbi:MAG: hypothetical protein H0W08_06435 [Acidobacteria bacterium]|nr:hypothetical protein [Acidobacteriota bacterium]